MVSAWAAAGSVWCPGCLVRVAGLVWGGCGRSCRGCSGSGDRPGSVGSGEAEVEQPAEVQGGGAGLEPGVVLGDASVADLAVPAGDEPGDGAFDHGSVLAVVGLPGGVFGP